MLSQLVIKNYALIQNLEVHPIMGLNIITGETGAGKSIMLGALGLLLGNRADTKALFNANEKCIIEARFEIDKLALKVFFDENELDYEPSCILRREIAPNGKSRAFINDTPVNLETLKALGQSLIDIHSQNDTLLLASNTFQLKLVDSFAQNHALLEGHKNNFIAFKEAEYEYESLKKNAAELKKEFDYNSFLFDELNEAALENTNQEEIEQELYLLENAEELKKKLGLAFQLLNNPEQSALGMLNEVKSALSSIAGFSDKYKDLKDRFGSALIELQDISTEIEGTEGKIETDDQQVILLKDKLNVLFKLQTKHGVKSNTELIEIRESLKQKINTAADLDNALGKLAKQKDLSYDKAQLSAKKLSEARIKILEALTTKTEGLIIELGMPEAKLKIIRNEKNLSLSGIDDIEFLFSANKGGILRSIKEVASGGEFSRMMLAFKYVLSEKNQLSTIIFDEIDTGISGEVAIKVGKMMQEMAKKLQVITITHLHQIAGRGQAHFYVYKDNTQSKTVSLMKKLNTDERIIEVAKMIGGEKPSESAIKSAIEMLEKA